MEFDITSLYDEKLATAEKFKLIKYIGSRGCRLGGCVFTDKCTDSHERH